MGVVVSPSDVYGTVVQKVPFIEGAEVTFSEDLSADFVTHWRKVIKKEIVDDKITEKLFNAMVKDWNFYYKNEKDEEVKVPVTISGMETYLSQRIQTWISQYMFDFLVGKRKN